MKTIKFKTNIKCSGCVAKVTPFLNEAIGENNWHVDTESPLKILTIENDNRQKAVDAVVKAGYKAEALE